MDDYLSPLPSDLALLSAKAGNASSLGLESVDSIIARLELARCQLAGSAQGSAGDTLLPLSSFVKTSNSKVSTAHKEWSSSVSKFGKGVEKRFTGPPLPLFPAPSPPPPPPASNVDPTLSTSLIPVPTLGTFHSPHAISSLNSTIALHLARLGAFETLETFLEESQTPQLDGRVLGGLKDLHAILEELRNGNCTKALQWLEENDSECGDLEFELRREEYCRLLLAGSDLNTTTLDQDGILAHRKPTTPDPHVQAALAYGGTHFRRFLTASRRDLISALFTSTIYLPFRRLLQSPYAPLYTHYIVPSSPVPKAGPVESSALCASFAAAFLERLGLPKESPLSVVTDIGGGGAMGRIQKVRNVMKEKKTEWSAVGELPVEIPLPPAHRYHSIFACPVSKEQSTSTNPPMLLPCGHVIARESLARLARGTPQLKCPYCPVVSRVIDAARVYF